jgi:hypothetical protein
VIGGARMWLVVRDRGTAVAPRLLSIFHLQLESEGPHSSI